MKSIVIFNSNYYPHIIGGAEISTQILAETLSQEMSVFVVTVGPHKSKVIWEEINNVKVCRLPFNNIYWQFDENKRGKLKKLIWHTINLYNIFQYKLIKKILKEIKPDLIHTQNLPGLSFSVWKAAEKLNIPIIHTLRDYSLLNPLPSKIYSNIYKKLGKKYSKSVQTVIGITNFVLQKHIDHGMFIDADQIIINNVVKQDFYYNDEIKNFNKSPLKIGYFGRVDKHKGVQYLLEAIKDLPDHVVSDLYICGSGEYLETLRKNNVDTRIHFIGKIPNKDATELMSKVDLTIVPSIWGEPFGRVVIESYQKGTPVLASIDGGIPEIIIDDLFLFEKANSKSIKNAIQKYFSFSKHEKELWSVKCIEYSKKFNTQMSLDNHIKAYKNVLINYGGENEKS